MGAYIRRLHSGLNTDADHDGYGQIPLAPLTQRGTFVTGNQAVGAISIGVGADTKNA